MRCCIESFYDANRKKFFILNGDVEEAIIGNRLLRDILYHQVCSTNSCLTVFTPWSRDLAEPFVMCDLCSLQIGEMFLGDVFVGMTGVDKDKALAQVRCILLHQYYWPMG